MQGEIRVTVIATGFDGPAAQADSPFGRSTGVLPFPQRQQRVSGGARSPVVERTARAVDQAPDSVPEMEIPTFIRRQMD
jgi:cell division GTPase FtsZ